MGELSNEATPGKIAIEEVVLEATETIENTTEAKAADNTTEKKLEAEVQKVSPPASDSTDLKKSEGAISENLDQPLEDSKTHHSITEPQKLETDKALEKEEAASTNPVT